MQIVHLYGKPDIAREAAEALSRRGLGELDVFVMGCGARPDADVVEFAQDLDRPLLVVRDARRLARQGPLRAVLGWDDTATSGAALDFVVAMRRHAPVDLEVVNVYFPDDAARRYGVKVESMVDRSPALEALLRRDLEHDVGVVPGHGDVRFTTLRALGRIADPLFEHVESVGADLIVVGTHHRAGLRRLSSVAAHVLGESSVAALLVPLRPEASLQRAPEFKTAAVATDGSAFANRAIPYAYRMIPPKGEVHLIRVVERHADIDDRALVEELERLCPPDRHSFVHVVRDQDPAHAIATTAERVGADVVCISSHCRTGLSKLLSGSVTDRLLHVCRRPVLVVHTVE